MDNKDSGEIKKSVSWADKVNVASFDDEDKNKVKVAQEPLMKDLCNSGNKKLDKKVNKAITDQELVERIRAKTDKDLVQDKEFLKEMIKSRQYNGHSYSEYNNNDYYTALQKTLLNVHRAEIKNRAEKQADNQQKESFQSKENNRRDNDSQLER